MWASPWAAVLLLVFAGCSGGPPETNPSDAAGPATAPESPETTGPAPAEPPPPPAATEAGPAIFYFERDFDVTVTQIMANNNRLNLDKNCVNFGKGTVWLVFNGTAVATWNANSPLAQRLEVEIWDGGGQGLIYTNSGSSSPSSLAFGQFRITQASTLGLAIIIQPPDPGAILGQAVKVHLSFHYIGRPDLTAKPIPCTYPEPSPITDEER